MGHFWGVYALLVAYCVIRLATPGLAWAQTSSDLPVAVYIDDIYIGAQSGTITGLNRIERIGVLKGPQGTLFGRDADRSVINFQTGRPSARVALDANIGYGNFHAVGGSCNYEPIRTRL
jgi:outer membrane receptor protein involved in Fe transport